MKSADLLTIGQVADRTGLAVSAVRFYADAGLVSVERSESGHRRFRRATIRRISFILICQRLGYSLAEIRQRLESLPDGRTPSEADWGRLGETFAVDIESRIAALRQLKDKLDGCIGCGCLSLTRCQIYNIADGAAQLGAGPRYLLGDSAADVTDSEGSR
ncbi:MAG: redox-sensitive transcriptional activator SoxR [Acidimicrobiales bacterium]|nr:redox-sensitive transcriptional activator SoxR [Acidimicrobiales bacterium]